jgi:tetratricopeptide (TPR) repeat protein
MTPIFIENNLNKFYLTASQALEKKVVYPNLSNTAIPIDALKARYFYNEKKYDSAKTLLWNSKNHNPYLFFNEALLSAIYIDTQEIDSAFYYAERIYKNFPNNKLHANMYIQSSIRKEKFKLADSIYDNIKSPVLEDLEIHNVYFSERFPSVQKGDSAFIRRLNKAIKRFPTNQVEFKNLKRLTLYGAVNVYRGDSLFQMGMDDFKSTDYKSALKNFLEAKKYNPKEFIINENIAAAYFLLNDFQNSIKYSSIVIDSRGVKSGKSYFLRGMSKINLNQKQEACLDFVRSKDLNYKNALSQINKYCK